MWILNLTFGETKLLRKESLMKKEKQSMDSLMTEERTFPPPAAIKADAHLNSIEQYEEMWERAAKDPDGFWLEQAKSLTWFKEPSRGLEYTWDTKNRKIEHTWWCYRFLYRSHCHSCLDAVGRGVAGKI